MKRNLDARLSRLERQHGTDQGPLMVIVAGVDAVTGAAKDSDILGYKRQYDNVIWRMEGESAEELRHRIAKELTSLTIFFEVTRRDGITNH